MTFRDERGGIWITAGEILDNLVRGDERMSLLDAYADGNQMYITDFRVVVDDPTTPEEGPLEG